jgi:hypothetical protein
MARCDFENLLPAFRQQQAARRILKIRDRVQEFDPATFPAN